MTTVGDIDSTSGAAIGQGNQAQNVTIHQHMEAPPETATTKEQINFQTRAILGLQQMFVSDRNERDSRQKENDQQFEKIERRLDALEELVRNAAYQARTDRLMFSAALVLLFIYAAGSQVGWW